jgi:pimeloyl-ACP methyl ester carboxylesterase
MRDFGVQKPELKALARTPDIPGSTRGVNVQYLKDYDPAGGSIPLYDEPQTQWKRFHSEETLINGVRVRIIAPERPARMNPWLLERSLADPAQVARLLLEKGFHYVCMDVDDFGSPQALERWNALYAELTVKRALSKKVVLQGYSRSGLGVYNWAVANPEKVACIYVDAPVLNIQSWPGGKGKAPGWPQGWTALQKAYGFASESEAIAYTNNPVDKAYLLAKANIPIIHVCGEKDLTVPYDENTGLFKERYEKVGGHNMTIIIKGGMGHWTHGLKDPTPVVDFILKAVDLAQ